MDKHIFRPKPSAWIWTCLAMLAFIIFFFLHSIKHERNYFLTIMLFTQFAVIYLIWNKTFIITPDTLIIVPSIGKKRLIMLHDITNIERKYTKRGKVKYIIVRYVSGQMFHNFFKIDGKMFDAEQMLQVIQEHYPRITIR